MASMKSQLVVVVVGFFWAGGTTHLYPTNACKIGANLWIRNSMKQIHIVHLVCAYLF